MIRLFAMLASAFLAAASLPSATAIASETRIALVIGNASYGAGATATPANDAALISQTLQAAGFEVTGARDLKRDGLRQAFSDFADRIRKAGPDAVAALYFAGHAVQFEGENYLLPTDVEAINPRDLPLRAVRLSDQMRMFAALHLKASFIIIDAARSYDSLLSDWQPAGGLAWVEPEANMLVAYSAAPGMASRDLSDRYGNYARALAEMIRESGEPPGNLFECVRLRVSDVSRGAQIPWHASRIQAQFSFVERGPDAARGADSSLQIAKMRSQPMRSLGVRDAYFIALLRDTFDGYTEFLANYWDDPLAKRVRVLLAARREAITWRRAYQANVPGAYWTYLERYPRGPHAADVRTLLGRQGASIAVPSKIAKMEYDVPGPLPDELQYIERTELVLDDPGLALEPPPALPAYILGPPPSDLWELPRPEAPSAEHALSVVRFTPMSADANSSSVEAPESRPVPRNVQERLPIRGAIEIPTLVDGTVAGVPPPQSPGKSPDDLAGTPTAATGSPIPTPTIRSEPLPAGQTVAATPGSDPSPPLTEENRPPANTPVIAPPRVSGQVGRAGANDTLGAIPLPVPRPRVLRTYRPAMLAPQRTGSISITGSSTGRPTPSPDGSAPSTRVSSGKPSGQGSQSPAISPSRPATRPPQRPAMPPAL